MLEASGNAPVDADPAPGKPADPSADADPRAGTVTLKEAAHLLGVSARTVRRRIQEGVLQGYKEQTDYGEVWRVYLGHIHADPSTDADPSTRRPPGKPADPSAPTAPELMKALEMVDRLQQQNQELTAAASHWQARYQDAERRAIYAEDQVKMLMAPKDEPAEPEPPAEPVRVSWWRRWWS